ncbi:ABC transporter substrate-binding protein [Corynebacterium sp. 13CS0277]|uniref:ABC transporter substrate-binding protein n=1 Tax=Corynebacterium sp. 13CS0277 TaxID=2071994 RepID=UPI001E501249|nr:ABC transporter substrate-binding protein [Corynebacterium sp. 13CS0277]
MRRAALLAGVSLGAGLLVACGSDAGSEQAASAETVTVTNCGEELTFPKTERMFINDGNNIAIALSAGARDQIKDVAYLKSADLLSEKYGADVISSLHEVSEEYPSFEQIVAASPQVYFAGYGYGLDEGKGITPDTLAEQGIATYQLTEACRKAGSEARGTIDPWEAVLIDIENIGAITGHEDVAAAAIEEQKSRLQAVTSAPKPEHTPVGFVFDTGTDTVFTSGKFGAPNAILEAAGATNAAADVDDTWVNVSWEKLAASAPDFFVFVDYPGQTFEEKVAQLRSNPATKDLPAVKENRFINLPYAMWTSGPLNVDAAEQLRVALEHLGLAPESGITPELTLPATVAGQEYYAAR